MGRKLAGLCPFGGGDAGPHLTQCGQGRGLPSFILIRPTVWPQYTNVTDRQTGQDGQTDNGLIAYGEPFYKRSPKN